MAVKLYNLSGLPDEPMGELLGNAMRLAGATGDVVVKVTRGGHQCGSFAQSCTRVAKWFLSSRMDTQAGKVRKGWVATNGGYVLMRPQRMRDTLDSARNFFEVAIHEFVHIRDYQNGGRFAMAWSRPGRSGRRPLHDRRPEELRAINGTDDALAKLRKQPERKRRIDDLIIALAVQMDEK